jgi:hypothetical protein
MAFSHGLNAVFKLHDGTSLRDLSPAGTSCSLDTSKDTVETTAFGSTSKSYIPGLRDATFSIEGARDATIEGYLWSAFTNATAAGLAWEYYPEGSGSGKVKYSGSCHLTTGPGPSASTDDSVKWSVEAQVTGDVTRAIV